MKLRFAPSPTGLLHVGNIRTALFNFLLAKQNKAKFFLRMDDTDLERSKPEYKEKIQQDLQWLGLEYDDVFYQSKRMNRYDVLRDKLIASGRLYPCYETSDELDLKRKRLLAKGRPPIYDRAALSLTEQKIQEYTAKGQKPHWRFKLNDGEITFKDLIRGDVKIQAKTISDPVLIRANGSYLYTLCSVIDDMDYEISHIVRGEDHVTNTASQIQIFEALGSNIPKFAHHPLLTNITGEKLSKRLGSLSIKSFQEERLEPLSILSYLARIGTSDPVIARSDIKDLVDNFDITRTSQSAAKFSVHDLEALNPQIIAQYKFNDLSPSIKTQYPNMDADFWMGVKYNIQNINEISGWYDIIYNTLDTIIADEDRLFLQEALHSLPTKEEWSDQTWKIWTDSLKASTGRKGKSLFMPLRQALSGLSHGPEMQVIIRLLGHKKVETRLQKILD